jgi:F-type H+-transporting ATPase subunit b
VPQLDVTTFLPQLFWLAVTFVALLLLMELVALPRVGRALDARRTRLDDDLARAAAMKSEAEAVLAAYQKTLAAARAEAQAAMKESAERLAAEAAERQRQLAASLAQDIQAAERRIAAAKESALSDIRGVAVELASLTAAKLTGSPADPRQVERAVDAALDGVGARQLGVRAGR